MAFEVSNQAIFLEECRRDPEFRNRVLCLERTLRVKAQKETNISDLGDGVDSDSVPEPVRSSELVVGAASAEASDRAATAGESQRIIGLRERYESDFPSLHSSGCVGVDACSRVPALPAASASLSSSAFPPASLAVVAHARSTPMHGAHNSWSDTVRYVVPRAQGWLKVGFPVRPKICALSQRWRRGKFSAGPRCTGAGLPSKQPGTGTRQHRVGVDTPSLHPEVPGLQFVSPGHGLEIRQSVGRTKVCGTTQSGIWVLKGNARARMLPDNFDQLRVKCRKQGTYETAWVTPGHDCLCSYKCGHGAAVRPQTNNAIWDGVIGLWGRVAPFLSPWCSNKDAPTG